MFNQLPFLSLYITYMYYLYIISPYIWQFVLYRGSVQSTPSSLIQISNSGVSFRSRREGHDLRPANWLLRTHCFILLVRAASEEGAFDQPSWPQKISLTFGGRRPPPHT